MKSTNSNESVLPYLGFGALFGYFLSKARATDYDTIVDMFMCREFQLYGVIMTAKALLDKNPKANREEIIAAMSGVLCRCFTHVRMLAAIEKADSLS